MPGPSVLMEVEACTEPGVSQALRQVSLPVSLRAQLSSLRVADANFPIFLTAGLCILVCLSLECVAKPVPCCIVFS